MSVLVSHNDNKIVRFKIVEGGKVEPKIKKDGTKKDVPNNNKKERWVYPIKSKNEVKDLVNYLHQKSLSATRLDTQRAAYRNWLLFIVGINVGLRVSDLIELRWKHIFEPDMKTFISAINKEEQKTKKMKLIIPNKSVQKAIMEYLYFSDIEPKAEEYIFLSGRKNKEGIFPHITRAAVEKMIKNATSFCEIKGNYNTHSLRKTYAYHKFMMYVNQGDPMALVKVQKDLNHRNSSDTARYLGITREEQIKSSMELGDYWEL